MSQKNTISRRNFLAATTVSTAALAMGTRSAWSATPSSSRSFEHGNPLLEFGYGDVSLAAGPHQAQLTQTHEILMGMNEDSLLRPYRLAVGLPAPGDDLGGWYSGRIGQFVLGPETFGQWVSALSRYHAITGDENSRAKVARLVEGFSKTIDPRGSMFAIRREKYKSYFYDKVVVGLIDAFQYCGVAAALPILDSVTRAAHTHLPGKALDELGPDEGGLESYTLPENQFLAWQRGGGESYKQAAIAYLHDEYFEPLANGVNALPGRHAYSHVNALCSAAKAYLVLGDEKYLKAAVNGFHFVEAQSYATGAWGPFETFLPVNPKPEAIEDYLKWGINPAGFESLGASIQHLKTHFETPCGCYAYFKLTRYLLRTTKNPHYGDCMERIMYNAALGALPLNQFGKAFYHSNYSKYATKQYFDGIGNILEDEWPCCSGTLPQLAADYQISAYFRDATGVFVNLYIPSQLRWREGGATITLEQAGDYPVTDSVTFTVEATKPRRFALRFRIPAWAHEPTIIVNGKAIADPVQPGNFAVIERQWRQGDKITVNLPKRLELKAVDEQHPDQVALCCGPLVLFAIGHDLPKLDRRTLLAAEQTAAASPEWRSGAVLFLPWWIIKDQVYTTYHDVS